MSTTNQCTGITKNKTRCKKHAEDHFVTCATHRNQDTLPTKAEIAAPIPEKPHKKVYASPQNPHPNLDAGREQRRAAKGWGRVVGFTPVEPGQQLRSARGEVRRAKRAARALRRAHARGNRRSA